MGQRSFFITREVHTLSKVPEEDACNLAFIGDPRLAPENTGIDAWEKTIKKSVDAKDINKLQCQIEREPMRVVTVKDSFRPNLVTSSKPNRATYLQQVLAAQKEAMRLQLWAAQHYKPGRATLSNMDQHRKPKGWCAERQFSSSSGELIP